MTHTPPLHRFVRWASLATVASLSACATGFQAGPKADVTQTAIDKVLAQARAERSERGVPKVPDQVSRALLEPSLAEQIKQAPLPEPRFDLVVTNAPVVQVFQAIGSGSRYSMLMPSSLSGTVSVNLKEVTLREALDVMREMYGFEYRIEGQRVMVNAPSLQTRIFQIAYPAARRSGRSDTRVVSGSIAGSPGGAGGAGASAASAQEGSQVATVNDADFWKEIEASLKAVVGAEAGRQIVLSQHTGVLVVRAFPKEMREVEHFLRASKVAIERQVMLEAKIVEVALKDGYESGVNWSKFTAAGNHQWSIGADPTRINIPGSLGRGAGVPTGSIVTGIDGTAVTATTLGQLIASPLANSGAGALGLAFTSNSFASLLAFLETQGSVQVLSSPRVAATNNQKAVLRVGTDDFFITNISTTTTSSASGTVTTPTIQTQPFFSGISLDVTPQIDEGGAVTLHIRPSVSVVSERTRVINLGNLGTFRLPLASSNINEADTIVRVNDGVTVAIGGLMSQTQTSDDSRVPGAGDLPVLGNLFKQTNRTLQKRELVFLLRPTVIKGDAQWQTDLASTDERLRSYPTAPRERLPSLGSLLPANLGSLLPNIVKE